MSDTPPSNLSVTAKSWALFTWIAAALVVGVMSTALVSPLYPLYQSAYQFTHAQISYIHIVYMAGVIVSLLFLGNLNSYFGYWKILRAGLVVAVVGLLLMAAFPTQLGLMSGRFLIGVGSGMLTTSTMLGLVATIPLSAATRASQYASIINVTGFGLGPLVGGIVAEFLPLPLVMPYLLMVLAAVAVSVQLTRKGKGIVNASSGQLKWLPDLRLPEPEHRASFWTISFGAFLAFGIFSFFASLATSFLHEFLQDAGPLINGLSVASVLLISGVVQFLAKSLLPRKSFFIGVCTLSLACILLIATIAFDLPRLFIAAVILTGMGHGFTLVASFGRLHGLSTPENKSSVLSTFLFIGYFGMIIPIVISGYISDWFGLNTGVVVFCLMMLSLACFLAVRTYRLTRAK